MPLTNLVSATQSEFAHLRDGRTVLGLIIHHPREYTLYPFIPAHAAP